MFVLIRNPLFFSDNNLFVMTSFSVGEISLCRGLYTAGSLRCTIAFLIYSCLSSTTIVEPLSALFMIICGFVINSLSAILSFLVRLSRLFCLCFSASNISILILCKNVSRVPLSVSLSGLGLSFCLGVKGSLGSLFRLCDVVFCSYIVFSLCIKFLISECKVCIGNCLGFGMNFNPFLSTLFCVSVRVVCLASMTKASSFLSFILLSVSIITCGSVLS